MSILKKALSKSVSYRPLPWMQFVIYACFHLFVIYCFARAAYEWGATDSSTSAFYTGAIGLLIIINSVMGEYE